MNLEDIVLSEVSQSQEDTCCMISLLSTVFRLRNKAEWRLPVAGGRRKLGVVV